MAAHHGYAVEFVDIGHALQEAEVVAALQDQQQQQQEEEAGLGPASRAAFGAATQAAIFRRQQGVTAAAAAQRQGAVSDGGLQRVWGPMRPVTSVGSLRSDAGQSKESGGVDVEAEHF
jgi:hypothetical protein